MNRQQFLAELNQYLTFFSPDERAKIITDYTAKFDSAGEDGEAGLLAELGTPMVVAIDLKRKKESGQPVLSEQDEVGSKITEENNFLTAYNVETETYESLTKPDEPEVKVEIIPQQKPIISLEKTEASGTKFVFAMIGATLLSIPLAVLLLALAGVGIMLVVAMGYLLLTGLKSLYYVTDALFLFSGGLVAGGLGLLIIWFAIWSAVSLISKLFRSALSLKPVSTGKERDAL